MKFLVFFVLEHRTSALFVVILGFSQFFWGYIVLMGLIKILSQLHNISDDGRHFAQDSVVSFSPAPPRPIYPLISADILHKGLIDFRFLSLAIAF